MPIELRCSQCDTLLRVPDGSEGRETRCPSCNTMLRIPGTSASQYPDSQYGDSAAGQSAAGQSAAPGGAAGAAHIPPGGRSPEQEANPFSSPTTSPETVQPGSSPFATGPPAHLDLGDLLGRSWDIYKGNIGLCLGSLLVVSMLTGFVLAIGVAVTALIAALASGGFNNDEVAVIVAIPVGLVCALGAGMVYSWLTVGLLRFNTTLSRTGVADFGLVFSGGDGMFTFLLSGILMSLAIGLGYAFCIVPGVIVSLIFSQRGWLIADRRLGVMDSLSMSNQITNGHKLNLFLLFLLQGVVGFMLGLIPYVGPFINLLLVQPYFFVVFATVYLTLTGQPTIRYTQAAQPMMAAPVSPAAAQPGMGQQGGGQSGGDTGTAPPPPDFG
jgi:LSD1 subclass zinc finger protein